MNLHYAGRGSHQFWIMMLSYDMVDNNRFIDENEHCYRSMDKKDKKCPGACRATQLYNI
jgi:hypothetical protein